jgi:hypothetical protein
METPDITPKPDIGLVESNPTLIEKMKDIGTDAKTNFGQTNLRGKFILASLGAMTAYEWGPGNEALTPYIGGQAIDAADGFKGIIVTAGITGGFTLAQQLTSSWLTRRTAQQFPDVATKAYNYMNSDADIAEEFKYKPFEDLPLAKKVLYPFTIGTSFVVAREAFVAGKTDEKELKRVGRKSAGIVAGSVAVFAGSIDMLDQAIPEGSIAQGVLDFFKTPTPYVAAVGAVLGKDYLTSRKHRKVQIDEQK